VLESLYGCGAARRTLRRREVGGKGAISPWTVCGETAAAAETEHPAMIKSEGPQDFDPLAPETFDSPYAVYSDLRQRCPVAHSQAWNGFWALMEYDDVLAALQQSDTYITSVQNVVPKLAFTGRRPPLHLDPPAPHPVPPRAQPAVPTGTNAGAGAGDPAAMPSRCCSLLLTAARPTSATEFTSHLSIYVFASWMNMPEHMLSDLRSIAVPTTSPCRNSKTSWSRKPA
jgi:hypothetical protein